ncbi:MAG: hypothetical protein KDJ15_07730 [Alphaproteobacteria bacterium]|nr:hypothetical protein [Alphaproteobacteria bacterium]
MATGTENTNVKPPKKFFFDVNNFNDDFVEEIVPEEPPPPMFSEEELAAARRESFTEGKAEGLAEAAAAREKFVAGVLEKIEAHFTLLFAAESERESCFETESVFLAGEILRKLFPALNARHGLEEARTVIKDVLAKRDRTPRIVIEVSADDASDIEDGLSPLRDSLAADGEIVVTGRNDMTSGDCRMRWKEGGAHRDSVALADQIAKQMEQILAGKPRLHDNQGEITEDTPATQPPLSENGEEE